MRKELTHKNIITTQLVHLCVCVLKNLDTRTCMHACVRACVRACVHTYIHTLTSIHSRLHTYLLTYTYIISSSLFFPSWFLTLRILQLLWPCHVFETGGVCSSELQPNTQSPFTRSVHRVKVEVATAALDRRRWKCDLFASPARQC